MPFTPLIMSVASLDTDLGYETLCSKIELNNSSSSSPSKGGCGTHNKNNVTGRGLDGVGGVGGGVEEESPI